ncbi:MAG: hypothetical protein U1D70_19490 [Methylobacter sp.]|nr:hypothetical protein [Methylobacter sp.]
MYSSLILLGFMFLNTPTPPLVMPERTQTPTQFVGCPPNASSIDVTKLDPDYAKECSVCFPQAPTPTSIYQIPTVEICYEPTADIRYTKTPTPTGTYIPEPTGTPVCGRATATLAHSDRLMLAGSYCPLNLYTKVWYTWECAGCSINTHEVLFKNKDNCEESYVGKSHLLYWQVDYDLWFTNDNFNRTGWLDVCANDLELGDVHCARAFEGTLGPGERVNVRGWYDYSNVIRGVITFHIVHGGGFIGGSTKDYAGKYEVSFFPLPTRITSTPTPTPTPTPTATPTLQGNLQLMLGSGETCPANLSPWKQYWRRGILTEVSGLHAYLRDPLACAGTQLTTWRWYYYKYDYDVTYIVDGSNRTGWMDIAIIDADRADKNRTRIIDGTFLANRVYRFVGVYEGSIYLRQYIGFTIIKDAFLGGTVSQESFVKVGLYPLELPTPTPTLTPTSTPGTVGTPVQTDLMCGNPRYVTTDPVVDIDPITITPGECLNIVPGFTIWIPELFGIGGFDFVVEQLRVCTIQVSFPRIKILGLMITVEWIAIMGLAYVVLLIFRL